MLHELPIDKALVGMFNATLPPVSLKACSCTKLMYVPPGLLTMRTPATSGQPPEAERLAVTDRDADALGDTLRDASRDGDGKTLADRDGDASELAPRDLDRDGDGAADADREPLAVAVALRDGDAEFSKHCAWTTSDLVTLLQGSPNKVLSAKIEQLFRPKHSGRTTANELPELHVP